MTKYVISEFCESSGLSQTIIQADSKINALLDYFDVETDLDGHLYLDVESLVADMGHELGHDVSIIKVSKKPKVIEEEEDYEEGYTPWPFPTSYPEWHTFGHFKPLVLMVIISIFVHIADSEQH